MLFRTELNLKKSDFLINHSNNILLLGSCFSDNIGQLLEENRFKTCINPFGTTYNSCSIQYQLFSAIHADFPSLQDLDFANDLFSHPNFHSSFNHPIANQVVENICRQLILVKGLLSKLDYIFITLGTSWVYSKIKNDLIVANCHKQDNNLFKKSLLTLEETIESLRIIISLLKTQNPNLRIIFTVSPVRHLKDGIIENQVSKAILLQAIYFICSKNEANYFPSYEFMMDDLRDYRFYNPDLIHPSKQATQYIFEKFSEHYFSQETLDINSRISKINSFLNHRPNILTEEFEIKKQNHLKELDKILNHFKNE